MADWPLSGASDPRQRALPLALPGRLALVCALFAASVAPVAAQVSTGVILGSVSDATGAAIVGANVRLTSTASSISATTLSSDAGNFVFPQVAVGQYTLEVTSQGFRRYQQSGIVLNVNQKVRIEAVLQVGEVADSVNVAGEALLVNTVDGEVGQTIVQKNVVDLPLKGRQFLELALLSPGAVDVPGDSRAVYQGIAPAVNGNSPEHNSYTLNGANNRQAHNGFFGIVPPVDSVEEFKIQSGSFNAEFGQASGAIVNVVTKAGTNAFHGSGYEFLRNDKLNARNYFNPARSPVKQNQFGGTLGGPIVKNRTFFFGNYERFVERRASTRSSRFPTQDELAGVFSTVVRDPANGTPFPGNRVPDNRIDPVAKKFAAYFPKNNASLGGAINYINNKVRSFSRDSYGLRLDHRLSDKDSLFGVVNWDKADGLIPGPIPDGPGEQNDGVDNKMVNVTYNRIFTPEIINELRFSHLVFSLFSIDVFQGRDYPTQLGLTGIVDDPSIRNRFPTLNLGQGYAGFARSEDRNWKEKLYQVQDNLSWVRGRHTLKFGGGVAVPRTTVVAIVGGSPVTFGFSGRFSGNTVADFLLGNGDTGSTYLRGGLKLVHQTMLNFYAQDQWQVTRHLTLNIGLRYEYHSPYLDPLQEASSGNVRTGALVVTKDAVISDQIKAAFPYPIERLSSRTLVGATNCCIGPIMPRFGFAWRAPMATVIRGGYAISQGLEISNNLNGALAFPSRIFTSRTVTTYPGIGYNTERATLTNLLPVSLQAIEDVWREGYTQSWNLTVEKQLKRGDLFSVAYVGSKGTHLSAQGSWNEAPPGPGSVETRRPFPYFATGTIFSAFGGSNYHALQAKAERRFANGLAYLFGYTYSKGLGNTASINETRILSGADPSSARGRLTFDVRQRFTGAVIYEVPFGKGKPVLANAGPWLNRLVGGWQVNTITAAQTGYPINLAVSPCLLNGSTNRCVPNSAGPNNGNLPRGERNVNRWFNTASFTAPAAYTQGNMQVFILDGPRGLNNWDTSFIKNTPLGESRSLQFRAEFFNLFNHTRFATVDPTLGSSTFGRVTASTGEREIQLALKLYF